MRKPTRKHARERPSAERFEAPISSPEHADLRETVWVGGPMVEGRYLLGRLRRCNYFRLSHDKFRAALHQQFATIMPTKAANILCDHSVLGMELLRYLCRHIEDIRYQRNPREGLAILALAKKPGMTNKALATLAQTTFKQVERMPNVRYFRRLLEEERDG